MYPDLDNFTGPEFEEGEFRGTRTAVIYDEDFTRHDTGPHPEQPKRLIVARQAILNDPVNEKISWLEPRICEDEDILRCHTPQHLENIRHACEIAAEEGRGLVRLDPDTVVSGASFIAARKAIGALCMSVDLVLSGKFDILWNLVRPPGHHAVSNRSMGFCLFNNVACGAEYAKIIHGMERILIIDYDCHHGNGTQDLTYKDSKILYTSIHQSYHYPGTGYIEEIGAGDGKGFNMNFPVLAGSGNDEFALYMKELVAPIALQFKPQLIFVSAGFDAHVMDPLCMLQVTTPMYGAATTLIKAIARETGAPIIHALEGGYSLDALSECIVECIRASTEKEFSEHDLPMRGRPSPGAMQTLDMLKSALAGYWEF